VIKRFQIEDLIVQDASGVVFRALDSETGKPVAVRRFFPFGASGGGLLPDEQTAYNIAIGRLSGIKHPALRSVISGGCDPVDGIPYIATEWVDGDSIQGLVDQGTFRAETATELLTQALEVCELLSQVLAEEAVWIETDLQTIIMGNHGSGRRFTFWISPLKWLGSVGDRSTGLLSIVTLAEQIMGWQGRVVHDQAAGGLGGWLKWLRSCAVFTSLREARENLAASVGAEPPPDADKLVAKATRPLLVTTSQPKARSRHRVGRIRGMVAQPHAFSRRPEGLFRQRARKHRRRARQPPRRGTRRRGSQAGCPPRCHNRRPATRRRTTRRHHAVGQPRAHPPKRRQYDHRRRCRPRHQGLKQRQNPLPGVCGSAGQKRRPGRHRNR
jgi:hypothetical protein